MKSFSFNPRVVRAGVPRRIPLGCRALWSPKIKQLRYVTKSLGYATMVLDFAQRTVQHLTKFFNLWFCITS